MDGCIYRTKDGECDLWNHDRNHSPFCRPDCDHKHPSNADHIRSMTDDELAKELDEKGYCPHNVLVCVNVRRWCDKCVRDWLRQEADI